MFLRIDLHLHTSFSDGHYNTLELLEKCRDANINTISIADHDTVEAHFSILPPEECGVNVIPGVELSCDFEGSEVHILGFYIDINNPTLTDSLLTFRTERIKRVEKILTKLKSFNFHLTTEEVISEAGNAKSVGRPHIASVMYKKGFVNSYHEAFHLYLANNKPAYEKKFLLSIHQAIEIIHLAGGLTFLAHPGKMDDEMFKGIMKTGLDGIEYVHPSHSQRLKKMYYDYAVSKNLLLCGGSDFHGGRNNDEKNLGNYRLPYSQYTRHLSRLAKLAEVNSVIQVPQPQSVQSNPFLSTGEYSNHPNSCSHNFVSVSNPNHINETTPPDSHFPLSI